MGKKRGGGGGGRRERMKTNRMTLITLVIRWLYLNCLNFSVNLDVTINHCVQNIVPGVGQVVWAHKVLFCGVFDKGGGGGGQGIPLAYQKQKRE